ncbi:two-component response regulator ARR10-like [Daucus carota subsp. sativus]|uniref:two-component response regulator ARR10-like n=1 Tax=Daucus carota subsp. sativus TaxID=79200 RepID=UPI003082FB42
MDDDLKGLLVAKAAVQRCSYEVTAVTHAALSLLEQKDERERPYDMVLADVHMPVMDGCELLRRVNGEFNLPVVLISADDMTNVIRKGLRLGALAFVVKPMIIDQEKLMWQHCITWKNRERHAWRQFNQANIPRISIFSSSSSGSTMEDYNPSERIGNKANWISNLHNRIVEVLLILGPKESVTKKTVEMTNVPWLTREQVASHLQKFRKFLDKVMDGTTSFEQGRNQWVDYHYYSSIVGGNPNQILLGWYITMSITNNHASSSMNVATLTPEFGGVAFESAENVVTTVQGIGGVPFGSAGHMNVEYQMSSYEKLTRILI